MSVLLLALLLSLAGGAAHAQLMHELAQGQHSGFHEPAEFIVLDEASWHSLWSQRLEGRPPPVDFTRDMVLGVALGERPTGGYAVRIERVEREADGTLNVEVREILPPEGALLTQALTQPYHFVRLRRVDGQVTFRLASEK